MKNIDARYIALASLLMCCHLALRSLGFIYITSTLFPCSHLQKAHIMKISLYSMFLNEVAFKGSGDIALYNSLGCFSKKERAIAVFLNRGLAFFSLIFTLSALLLFKYVVAGISLLHRARNIFYALIAYSGAWLAEAASLTVIFNYALHYSLGFTEIYYLLAFYTILGYMLFIPSSLGVREAVFVIFSFLLSHPVDLFLIGSLALRICFLLSIGVIYAFIHYFKE